MIATTEKLYIWGRISAGKLELACGDPEEVDLVDQYLQRGCFLVQTEGESMIGDKIFDQDWLILNPRQARPGEVVVVQRTSDDGEITATVKRWFPKGEWIELRPSNQDHRGKVAILWPAMKVWPVQSSSSDLDA